MNSELGHLVYLVAHAKSICQKGQSAIMLSDGREYYQYISDVQFLYEKNHYSTLSKVFSFKKSKRETPGEWFRRVQNYGLVDISIARVSMTGIPLEREIQHSFSTSGLWAIEISITTGREYWRADWISTKKLVDQQPRWRLLYQKDPQFSPLHLNEYSIELVRQRLYNALSNIQKFSYQTGLDMWAKYFSETQRLLECPDVNLPESAFKTNGLLPDTCYSHESRLLLEAADKSDVFGGMGSWNDVVLESSEMNDLYKEYSRDLFEAFCDTVETVVNAGIQNSRQEP